MSEEPYTVEDGARAATRMLRNKVAPQEIKELLGSELSKAETERAYAFAKLRKDAGDRFEQPWELFFDESGLRYATPDTVARARTDRLAEVGGRVVDVACGVGIQLAFLARAFDEAVGVELDPDKAELARRNLEILEVDAEVIEGDCLDPTVREGVGDVDVVVCDPARDPEARERRFEDLSPRLEDVHTAWSEQARAFMYELPPMMPPERVHEVFDGECEYTSLNGELNRLALYGGELDRTERSALSLPAGERLTDEDPAASVERVGEPDAYVHLVDRAVLQADLLGQLVERSGATGLLSDDHPRRTLITGPAPAGSAFLEDYEVLATHEWSVLGLHHKLEHLGAGKVTLRTSIDPERYWDVRNALEEGLTGDLEVHLFRVDDAGIICQPLDAHH